MITAEVLKRIREGANVPVAPLARVVGCSPNHLWKLVRDGEIEAVKVGTAIFIPARVAAPLVGIKPEPIAA
ncbi:helix-turn-helix domain-containing protein [Methylobacterium oryzisoli]|uniref:helix-turn-helix domain-containing protein n=1 Tax=Methylobacterium oryzisoli TaxID=3385502 RepID=UPI0038925054